MPLLETKGAASAQGFGEFSSSAAVNYIEDVFSTYLYTGNGSTQTITNGIDLSTKGGLVWMKGRSGATNHALYDTVRGATKDLVSNSTAAETTQATGLTAFSGTGFSIGALAKLNTNAATYASWTFREQAKFFDIVTYTGNSTARTIAHNLGSVPGCIIIKWVNTAGDWTVYHRGIGNQTILRLNSTSDTSSFGNSATYWNNTDPTSTHFSLGNGSDANLNGYNYIAYLFAHDAGGFGLNGTDNVISCGSFTTDGSGNATVTLGYEPQWAMVKNSSAAENWLLKDNMRGTPVGTAGPVLYPNSSSAEGNFQTLSPTATGFSISGLGGSATYIYIAIRRGPMKAPTIGTQIANPKGLVTLTSGQTVTTGFVTDMSIAKFNGTQEWLLSDRLRNAVLYPNTTDSEGALYGTAGPRPFDVQDGFKTSGISGSYALWGFRRAPGFMDVVCYTGTGSATTFSHNLGVVPEMMIVKRRNTAADWWVYDATTGNTKYQVLNSTATPTTSSTAWNNTTPTSSVFSVGTGTPVNASAGTYVAYLFATVAGVSKVGSYTGTGTTNQINCGFTTGARFVLIKRTDTTGNWHLYDSGQGIVAGNDPYFLVNTDSGQFTGTDYVDTYSAGFELSSTAPAGLNANGGTYIFLAIA